MNILLKAFMVMTALAFIYFVIPTSANSQSAQAAQTAENNEKSQTKPLVGWGFPGKPPRT